MSKQIKEKRTFWIDKFEILFIAQMFFSIVKDSVFSSAKLVFTGQTRKVAGRTFWSPQTTQYAFEIDCDIQEHCEIPGYLLVGYCEIQESGWTVYSLSDKFDFTQTIVDQLDPKRCDVCGIRHSRKKLYLLQNKTTQELVYVGGSCAKSFKSVNIEQLVANKLGWDKAIDGFLSSFNKEEYGYCSARREHELAEAVAVGELLISRLGYVSGRKAGIEMTLSTGNLISDYFHGRSDVRNEIRAILDRSRLDLQQRIKALLNGELEKLREYFEDKQDKQWSEFNHNMITWLSCEKNVPFGIAAYFAKLNVEGDIRKEKEEKQVSVKGFSGPEIGKMNDLGWFKIVKTSWRTNQYNGLCELGMTCLTSDGQKLWFKVGETSAACKAYENIIGDESVALDQDVWVLVRGKMKAVKDEISFASHIKFKKVEVRNK